MQFFFYVTTSLLGLKESIKLFYRVAVLLYIPPSNNFFLILILIYLNFSAYSPAFGTVTIFLTSAFVIKCVVVSIYSYNLHYLIAKHSKHAFVCLFVICCLSLVKGLCISFCSFSNQIAHFLFFSC